MSALIRHAKRWYIELWGPDWGPVVTGITYDNRELAVACARWLTDRGER